MRIRCLSALVLLAGAGVGGAAETAPEQGATTFAPGVVSDRFQQWRVNFDRDGNTAWFAESEGFFPITRQASIYVSRRVDGAWSEPELAPFSGTHPDIDPALTPDGKRLYFSSIRTARGDIDLWYVDRVGEGWGDPVRLGDEVNTADDELYPSVGPDGTLYFASGPAAPAPGRHWDIYEAKVAGEGFAKRTVLPAAINTVPSEKSGPQDAWEFNPEISPDGKHLFFCSLRPGGAGLGDIYVSTLRDGEWSPAVNAGPAVNTAADEYHPTLSRDGRTLYFARRVPETGGDFFEVPVERLRLE